MDNRPRCILIFVEDQRLILHAQLQQVFIRNVLELLNIEGDDGSIFGTKWLLRPTSTTYPLRAWI